MDSSDEAEIAVVGTKGQIVIPQEMRKQLAIGPKTKLAIYRRDDKLIVTKISLPAISGEIDALLDESLATAPTREMERKRRACMAAHPSNGQSAAALTSIPGKGGPVPPAAA